MAIHAILGEDPNLLVDLSRALTKVFFEALQKKFKETIIVALMTGGMELPA